MLACADDLIVLQNFVFGDTPTPLALRSAMDSLLRQGPEFSISQYELSRTTDIRPLVLETVLTYLELDGVLTPVGAFYNGCQIRFVQTEARVLAGHTPERQTFLKKLFASGKRGYKWTTISDIDVAAESIGETRERVMKALNYLEEGGDIELKPSGMRHRYRMKEGTPDIEALVKRMQELFAVREAKDAERLHNIMAFAQDKSCLTRHLLRYFGEDLEADCGHCSSCLNPIKKQRTIPRSAIKPITAEHVPVIQALIKEGHAALRAPRQIARFLCGITSPATTRDKLTKHDAFALLQDHPFQQVLDQAISLMPV